MISHCLLASVSALHQAACRIHSPADRRLPVGLTHVGAGRGPAARRSNHGNGVVALKAGAAVVGFLDPLDVPAQMQTLAERGLTLLAYGIGSLAAFWTIERTVAFF